MLLLDANFLIDLHREIRRGDADGGPANAYLRAHRTEPMAITPVSAAEYAVGIRHERESRRFLRKYRFIPLGRAVAATASRVGREQRARGQPLGENDTWQAAVALHFDLILVTDDRDFDRVLGLKIDRYRE